ncbi:MAG: leader peptidase (prepilin peptidase) / N-methyltransferase [Patescibacteria group bacterium]|nr:leader peptidase (prepilin peptidase) / N-methyltransferase [Patescibacteria group bacterium]
MENIVLAYLFFIGTCFGSFISVIVHRLPDYLKKGNAGIMNGRSQCGSCGKTLGWKELVPIFSWVFQGGRCSSCKKKIPFTYPALELVTGGLFAASAKYLCNLPLALSGDWSEISRVFFFLVVAFVTVTFVFYDIVYQEIPDEILVPATAAVGILLLLLPEGNSLFRHFEPVSWNGAPLGQGMNALFGAVAIYSFFYLQFLIPVGTFCLKNKRYKDALEVLGYYVYLPVAVLKDVSFRLVGKKPAVPEGDSGLE